MQIKKVTLANGQTMQGIYSSDNRLIATVDTLPRAMAFIAEIDRDLRAERLRHAQTIVSILRGESVQRPLDDLIRDEQLASVLSQA